MNTEKLKPTQELIIEVLVARYRLGETIWPFEARLAPQIAELNERGIVHWADGNVEGTVRAWLKNDAIAKYIGASEHVPQGFKKRGEEIANYLKSLGLEDASTIVRTQFGRES